MQVDICFSFIKSCFMQVTVEAENRIKLLAI